MAIINVDQNRNLGTRYGVRSIPSLVVLKDGEVVGSFRPRHKDQIVAEFRELL